MASKWTPVLHHLRDKDGKVQQSMRMAPVDAERRNMGLRQRKDTRQWVRAK